MDVQFNGLDEVLSNLRHLVVDESLENKALNKAGKITQEAIIAESTFGDRSVGTIAKNIKLRRPKNGETIIHTGRAFHAHLVEFGRSGGSAITKSGKHVKWGPTSPNPFFTRGFESSQNEAKQAMIDELQKGLGL